ncbi:bZIP transcription factor 12-like isoform X2 [Curcuma longa]|uniref:bZIP transcription factor 12-like isoform X2 n=1 Tax=Curcuma longa TaxID=136217 RepID=UPI003D9FA66B
MLSSSSPNSDLARPSGFVTKGLGSASVEDHLFRNVSGGGLDGAGKNFPLPEILGERTAEDMWRVIAADRGVDGSDAEVTLEDFLARAGAVGEEEDTAVPTRWSQVALAANTATGDGFGQPQKMLLENPTVGFGNGAEGVVRAAERGRKRPLLDPVDRMAIQREKRMIKNRESAARSRERKQAYINQLEASVAKLEEDNARLLKTLQQRMRLKQLMENVIPVAERERRPLRRTNSMQW